MLYQDRLKKWAVVRFTAGSEPVVLERFRSVADAEGHVKVLRKQMPRHKLMVIFDRPQMEETVLENETKDTASKPNEVNAG